MRRVTLATCHCPVANHHVSRTFSVTEAAQPGVKWRRVVHREKLSAPFCLVPFNMKMPWFHRYGSIPLTNTLNSSRSPERLLSSQVTSLSTSRRLDYKEYRLPLFNYDQLKMPSVGAWQDGEVGLQKSQPSRCSTNRITKYIKYKRLLRRKPQRQFRLIMNL